MSVFRCLKYKCRSNIILATLALIHLSLKAEMVMIAEFGYCPFQKLTRHEVNMVNQ